MIRKYKIYINFCTQQRKKFKITKIQKYPNISQKYQIAHISGRANAGSFKTWDCTSRFHLYSIGCFFGKRRIS